MKNNFLDKPAAGTVDGLLLFVEDASGVLHIRCVFVHDGSLAQFLYSHEHIRMARSLPVFKLRSPSEA